MSFDPKLKDPGAHLDFGFDWANPADPWLAAGETITDSTWTITGPDSALVKGSSGVSGGATTVWLDGGTAGSDYEVTNRITTSANRVDERTFVLKVRNR